MDATSVPSRAILARRFFATFTEAPASPHLLAQLLHLGDREAGIVSDDDDVGGLEDPVQRLDGRFLFRSIHVGTLFGWRPCSRRVAPAVRS